MEQARKFARRHPRLASSATVAGAAAMILLAVGSALAAARSQLADARARDLVREHDAGMQKALCLVNTRLDLQDHLRDGIAVCERTLALFGDPDERRTVDEPRRPCGPARPRGSPSAWPRTAASCCCSWPTPASGWPPDRRTPPEQALRLLDAAEAIPGLPPSRALWLDRARYRSLLGESGPGGRGPPARRARPRPRRPATIT